jgi:hypothetical protein
MFLHIKTLSKQVILTISRIKFRPGHPKSSALLISGHTRLQVIFILLISWRSGTVAGRSGRVARLSAGAAVLGRRRESGTRWRVLCAGGRVLRLLRRVRARWHGVLGAGATVARRAGRVLRRRGRVLRTRGAVLWRRAHRVRGRRRRILGRRLSERVGTGGGIVGTRW